MKTRAEQTLCNHSYRLGRVRHFVAAIYCLRCAIITWVGRGVPGRAASTINIHNGRSERRGEERGYDGCIVVAKKRNWWAILMRRIFTSLVGRPSHKACLFPPALPRAHLLFAIHIYTLWRHMGSESETAAEMAFRLAVFVVVLLREGRVRPLHAVLALVARLLAGLCRCFAVGRVPVVGVVVFEEDVPAGVGGVGGEVVPVVAVGAEVLGGHEALPEVGEEQWRVDVVLGAVPAQEVEVAANVLRDVVHHHDRLAPHGGGEGHGGGVGARDAGPRASETEIELRLEDGEDQVKGRVVLGDVGFPGRHNGLALLEELLHGGRREDEGAAAGREAVGHAGHDGVAEEPLALGVVLRQPVERVLAVHKGVVVDKGVPAAVGAVVPGARDGLQDLVLLEAGLHGGLLLGVLLAHGGQRDAPARMVDLLAVAAQLLVLADEVGRVAKDDVEDGPGADVRLQVREDERRALVLIEQVQQRRGELGVHLRRRRDDGDDEVVVAHAVRAERRRRRRAQAARQLLVVVVARPALDPHEAVDDEHDGEQAPRARDCTGEHRRYRRCSIGRQVVERV
jgi:hypothetical protein